MGKFEGETFSYEQSQEEKHRLIEDRNSMQIALMLEGAPPEGETKEEKEVFNTYLLDWSEHYAPKFEPAFNQMMSENNHLLDDWEDLKKREQVIDRIKELMGIPKEGSPYPNNV
ncbi:MAG: hypothetical protein Q8O98_00780 [bacterium]|nr:hypothetical protein [bacterium]